jgi:hypothetical protein
MKFSAGILITALVAAAVGAGTLPAQAHHAFASEYDIDKPITLKGVLTRLEWINPHGWVYVDVKDPKTGQVVNWAIEFGSPNALLRRGLRKTDFPVGSQVTVQGYLAKNGKPIANGTSVVLPDGRNFFTGSSGGPGGPAGGAG